jgi:hypothetical protein
MGNDNNEVSNEVSYDVFSSTEWYSNNKSFKRSEDVHPCKLKVCVVSKESIDELKQCALFENEEDKCYMDSNLYCKYAIPRSDGDGIYTSCERFKKDGRCYTKMS